MVIADNISCSLVPLLVLVSFFLFLGVFWASVDKKRIFYIELF